MISKNAMSAVVASITLVGVSVIAILSFSNWFGSYTDKVFLKSEGKNSVGDILFLSLSNGVLYIKSQVPTNISSLSVSDVNGNELCVFDEEGDSNLTGLVGYWKFDNITNNLGVLTIEDYSGFGNNGSRRYKSWQF